MGSEMQANTRDITAERVAFLRHKAREASQALCVNESERFGECADRLTELAAEVERLNGLVKEYREAEDIGTCCECNYWAPGVGDGMYLCHECVAAAEAARNADSKPATEA